MRDIMWTDEQQQVVVDYCLGRISRMDLLKRLPFDVDQIPDEIRRQLTAALLHKSGELVETMLSVASIFGVPFEHYADLLWLLVTEDWHYKHEDIIGFLQDSADPRAIPLIIKAIDLKPRLEYLAYDDYGSYYKKCLWALQDIGTLEAIAVIENCTKSQDTALAEEAFYRLSKIKAASQ